MLRKVWRRSGTDVNLFFFKIVFANMHLHTFNIEGRAFEQVSECGIILSGVVRFFIIFLKKRRTGSEVVHDLVQLKQLKDSGAVTPLQYDALRSEILDGR